jgi:hypothetical protein
MGKISGAALLGSQTRVTGTLQKVLRACQRAKFLTKALLGGPHFRKEFVLALLLSEVAVHGVREIDRSARKRDDRRNYNFGLYMNEGRRAFRLFRWGVLVYSFVLRSRFHFY